MSTSSPTEISTWGCTIALWSRLSVACERSQHTCLCPSCDSGLCRATPLCIACQVKLWITAGQTRQEHSFYRQPLRPSRYASCHAMTPVEVVVQPADYWQQLNHAAGKQQTTQVSTLPAQQPPVGSLYCSTGWRRRFIRQQSSHNTHAVDILTDDVTQAQDIAHTQTHTHTEARLGGVFIHFEPLFGLF